jgi:hypothetical protein
MEKRTNSRLLGFFQSRWRDEQESPLLHPPQSVKTLSLSLTLRISCASKSRIGRNRHPPKK